MENIKLTPKRKEIMEMMGFDSIKSLLCYYPYRYDYYKVDKLSLSMHDKKVTFEGFVSSDVKSDYLPGKKVKTSFTLSTSNNTVSIILFNRMGWASILKKNTPLVVVGKYNAFKNEITVSNFFVGQLNGKEKYVPVYSLPSSIKESTYKSFVEFCYQNAIKLDILSNKIPQEFIEKYKLIPYSEAIYNIHFPSDQEALRQANRHLKYEEFLSFCLTGAIKRRMLASNSGLKIKNIDDKQVQEFINSLPFKLTSDQVSALGDILADLRSKAVMSRLLQGDVGSGKTIVAIIALIANFTANYQGTIMAPTDILARQHYNSLLKLVDSKLINVKLLVSDMPSSEKQIVLEDLENGSIDIVIGTHALIQESVKFKNLGLAIIDEQHKFGVKQRVALKEKGKQIDVLYMSATPIPRTLASTIYMDMDVSTIEVYPYSERKINTYYIKENSLDKVKSFIYRYLNEKKKIYVVCPSIEDNSLDLSSVTSIYKKLQDEFKQYQVGLVHGKMAAEVKNSIIDLFKSGDIQILVSTTVIEVGIDIKDANMMIIYNAERFGLASIHQLRGRIARDGQVGYCYLLSDAIDEDAIDRLTYVANNNNGFKISEYDLKRRGAGDMLGLAQSGKSPFVIANLIDDFNILKAASSDVNYIMQNQDKFKPYIDNIKEIINKTIKYVD